MAGLKLVNEQTGQDPAKCPGRPGQAKQTEHISGAFLTHCCQVRVIGHRLRAVAVTPSITMASNTNVPSCMSRISSSIACMQGHFCVYMCVCVCMAGELFNKSYPTFTNMVCNRNAEVNPFRGGYSDQAITQSILFLWCTFDWCVHFYRKSSQYQECDTRVGISG